MFFFKRKLLRVVAEQSVDHYMRVCKEADEALNWIAQMNLDVEDISSFHDIISPQITIHHMIIDTAFAAMKEAVGRCPRRFRNKMARKIAAGGYAG